MEPLTDKLQRIGAWWRGEGLGRPLLWIDGVLKKDAPPPISTMSFWPAEGEPDFEGYVNAQYHNMLRQHYPAETFPSMNNMWGGRGTPMTLAAYLGGDVTLGNDTVWVHKIAPRLDALDITFNPANHWAQIDRKLMEAQMARCDGSFLIRLPDFGDALTNLSLLRGVEELLFDLIENPDVLRQKVDDFARAFIDAHRYYWSIYRQKLPGDASWLVWCPGRTYVCQCDFSVMISPEAFRRLVIPELQVYSQYLDMMFWHLDGYQQVRHLDALLEMPKIYGVQIVPGAGNPPCASDRWIPPMQKIQGKGKLVWASAASRSEVETLLSNLNPEKLAIKCNFSFVSLEEAEEFVDWVTRLSKRKQPIRSHKG